VEFIKKIYLKMYKISANIVCNNEKYWIRESILSIVNIVDEIIYVDDRTTDGSLNIVEELSVKYNNIKIFKFEDHNLTNLGDLKNFALSVSTNDFVIRWDADFIAYDDINKLFEFCEKNKDIYDGYILTGPNLSGDIYHQPLERKTFGPECYLFDRNKCKFISNDRYPDYPSFESEFKYCYPNKTELDKNYFFVHTNNLKSLERLSFRKKMCEYHLSGSSVSYWEWLNPEKNEEETKRNQIYQTINEKINIIDFEFDIWGSHPSLLINSKSINLFKVYKDGDEYKAIRPID
jgi:glycosyltransferase involved in cell wall biosynthesis